MSEWECLPAPERTQAASPALCPTTTSGPNTCTSLGLDEANQISRWYEVLPSKLERTVTRVNSCYVLLMCGPSKNNHKPN